MDNLCCPVIFLLFQENYEKREIIISKRNKYSFLIFCFLFPEDVSIGVLLGLRAFSCDFGMELLYYVVVVQSLNCLTLCHPMTAVRSGLPLLHFLQEFAQTYFHDTIQPSHPLWPSFPSAFKLSQHQGLFQ